MKQPEFHVIIPARFASSRLPGKMLLPFQSKHMILHVYERALQSGANSVCIATDHPSIVEAAEKIGATVYMTSEHHPSGTDRVAEAAKLAGLSDEALIVNVQGDQPWVDPRNIAQVAQLLIESPDAAMATLSQKIVNLSEWKTDSIVKVVTDEAGYALYFSRAPIPAQSVHDDAQLCAEKHIGIYAYRNAFLQTFVRWPKSVLESLEQLEQLRVLSNGFRIRIAAAVGDNGMSIDTDTDFKKAVELFAAG